MKANSAQVDPVCHMTVGVAGDSLSADFKGSTYYFCAETCKEAFLANPQKYMKGLKPKRKGFWQRYLDRLNKSTGGKPPSCCH